MNRFLMAAVLIAWGVGSAAAQQYAPPSCEALPSRACNCGHPQGCQRCNPCQPTCQPKEPCQPPGPPREGVPPEQPELREVGAYVAPPRTGSTRGASNFRGFDLGSFTLPELRFRLPSIELPSCFHGRHSARMNVDSSTAQWESQGYVATAPRVAVVDDRAASSPRNASERAAAERSACEEYSRKLKEYEDELRRIDEDRKKLEDCIRQCLEANRRDASIPRSELNCLSNERNEPAAADPNCDRNRSATDPALQPPVPMPDARRMLPPSQFPVQYHERPASYITEPQHLPQTTPARAQPIVEPQANIQPAFAPIREPRPIQARITNVRLSR